MRTLFCRSHVGKKTKKLKTKKPLTNNWKTETTEKTNENTQSKEPQKSSFDLNRNKSVTSQL